MSEKIENLKKDLFKEEVRGFWKNILPSPYQKVVENPQVLDELSSEDIIKISIKYNDLVPSIAEVIRKYKVDEIYGRGISYSPDERDFLDACKILKREEILGIVDRYGSIGKDIIKRLAYYAIKYPDKDISKVSEILCDKKTSHLLKDPDSAIEDVVDLVYKLQNREDIITKIIETTKNYKPKVKASIVESLSKIVDNIDSDNILPIVDTIEKYKGITATIIADYLVELSRDNDKNFLWKANEILREEEISKIINIYGNNSAIETVRKVLQMAYKLQDVDVIPKTLNTLNNKKVIKSIKRIEKSEEAIEKLILIAYKLQDTQLLSNIVKAIDSYNINTATGISRRLAYYIDNSYDKDKLLKTTKILANKKINKLIESLRHEPIEIYSSPIAKNERDIGEKLVDLAYKLQNKEEFSKILNIIKKGKYDTNAIKLLELALMLPNEDIAPELNKTVDTLATISDIAKLNSKYSLWED
jgi:hypothetical protein